MSTASRKYQEAVLNGNADDIGGVHRLGMPGHRAAFTRHMKTHRQLSSHQCDGIGSFRKRKGNGVALYRLAGGDRDARLATKRHRLIGARYHGRTAALKADKHTVEGDRLGT